ncbi:MAG TPA: hypothetical protein VLN59_01445, partial [Burkholderiales bacterium]|nr:hypothetical protein [Burkholderiales bacterium]
MEASCTPFCRVVNRAVALTLIVGLPQWALAVQDPFAGLPTLKDEQLDELRGGFESIQGFQFSFAIERAVVINGELVTSTRLVLNDLSPLLSGGMPTVQLITSARNIVQNGLGNAISPAPAATAAPPAPAASAASTTTMPAVSNAPGSAVAPTIATVPSAPGAPAVSVAPSPVA